MKTRPVAPRLIAPRFIALGLAALAIPFHAALAADTPPATAVPTPPPTHIALVDILKVRKDCKEFDDINKINSSERSAIQAQLDLKQTDINNLKSELQNDIQSLAPGAEEISRDKQRLYELNNNVDSWAKNENYLMLRQQNLREYSLYQSVQTAIAEVCKAKGFDMAIVITSEEVPKDQIDDADPQKLFGALYGQRLVVYHNEDSNVVITQDVIAQLNTDYKAAGNAVPPGPPIIPPPVAN